MGDRLKTMRARSILVGCSLAVMLLAGCEKKRTQPPMALAKLPDLAYPVVLPPQPEEAPAPEPATTTTTATNVKPPARPPRPRPKPKVEKIPEKPTTATSGTPAITPSETDGPPTISAGSPHSVETDQQQSTADLIRMTEEHLRTLNRQLSDTEQRQVDQIRSFVAQAKTAITENDPVRAHNLALKAHLLSDELTRH